MSYYIRNASAWVHSTATAVASAPVVQSTTNRLSAVCRATIPNIKTAIVETGIVAATVLVGWEVGAVGLAAYGAHQVWNQYHPKPLPRTLLPSLPPLVVSPAVVPVAPAPLPAVNREEEAEDPLASVQRMLDGLKAERIRVKGEEGARAENQRSDRIFACLANDPQRAEFRNISILNKRLKYYLAREKVPIEKPVRPWCAQIKAFFLRIFRCFCRNRP